MSELLAGLSTSREAQIVLVVLIALLVGLLFLSSGSNRMAPTRPSNASLIGRLVYQANLFAAGRAPLRERTRSMLQRGGRTDGEVMLDSDFFLLVRIVVGAILGLLGLLLMLVTGSYQLAGVSLLGFVAPSFVAMRYNAGRRKRYLEEMPRAMRMLETRIGPGVKIGDAFRRVAEGRSGPLWSELAWASAQMSIPSANMFEVLRELDARNNVGYWAPLADQLERASRRGQKDVNETFLAAISRLLEDEEARRNASIASLPNKVIFGSLPFLLIALMIGIGGPFLSGLLFGNV